MLIGPLLIGAGMATISGLTSFLGQKRANKANREESQRNRAFQERMSSTEWQRGVKDMEMAGLNPALAYSQGAASTPSGSVASKQESEAGAGYSSALATKTAQESFKLLRAQKDAAIAQSRKTDTEAQILNVDRFLAESKMGFYFKPNGQPNDKLKTLLANEHGAKLANGARSVSEMNLSQLRQPELRALAKLFDQVGAEGKGIQTMMPLLVRLLQRGR